MAVHWGVSVRGNKMKVVLKMSCYGHTYICLYQSCIHWWDVKVFVCLSVSFDGRSLWLHCMLILFLKNFILTVTNFSIENYCLYYRLPFVCLFLFIFELLRVRITKSSILSMQIDVYVCLGTRVRITFCCLQQIVYKIEDFVRRY